jgi:hypothetical protein
MASDVRFTLTTMDGKETELLMVIIRNWRERSTGLILQVSFLHGGNGQNDGQAGVHRQ